MTALDALKDATRFLQKYGVEDAAREAETIVVHCLGTDRAAFFRDNPDITKDVIKKIYAFLKRRAKREPLQYILGFIDFLGLKIKVGKGVLIPRPETEFLAEEAIKTVKREVLGIMCKSKISEQIPNSSLVTHHSSLNIIDLCTGSGCLALALAKAFPDAQVYGTDISGAAIKYAKRNAEVNDIKNVTFLKGSLFEPLKKSFTFDLIISNPPYIKKDDVKTLQPEIKDWEPIEALDGGEDGLDYYRLIIPRAKNYLKDSRYLMLELGLSQADAIREIAEDAGFKDTSFIKDYAGIERITVAKNTLQ
jgi:release factor glutamine methyltransferase